MVNNVITVFEHETLYIDESFRASHFEALVKFNDAHGSKYFKVGFQKITFSSYVGVIQINNCTIEILPKADSHHINDDAAKKKWQRALVTMLQAAGYIKINKTENALQRAVKATLLDIFLFDFLNETQKLVQHGLLKKYRKVLANSKSLKGRLLIGPHIQHNLIHKERFYTEHSVYDVNNLLNKVLKRALKIIISTTNNHILSAEFSKLFLHFDNVDIWDGPINDLEMIILDRKSNHYNHALELAKLIIKSLAPDLSAGKQSVIAILFNMNALFEKYVLQCFQNADLDSEYSIEVLSKERMPFWKSKSIIPDIIISLKQGEVKRKVIIDTKWKVIAQDAPSDEDLKQMYAYNMQFGAFNSILLYPKTDQENLGVSNYVSSAHMVTLNHGCELYFAELFEEGLLSQKFAQRLIQEQLNALNL